ncbi:C2H2 type zinc finger domain protein [Penicillium malachiteum]|nr:C2H2 type zinc finger domain protein [Penicillium malachiteum]
MHLVHEVVLTPRESCQALSISTDLLARHKKVHENDTNRTGASQDDIPRPTRGSTLRDSSGAVNLSAKRRRQSGHNGDTGLRDSDPKVSNNNSVPNPEIGIPELAGPAIISTDEADLPNLDFQWPFFHEILQDASLDWTLDFLSNGVSTGSPLDLIHSSANMTEPIGVTRSNSGLHQGGNDHDYQARDDGTEDPPEAWLDQETGPGSIRNHRPPPEISEAAGYINMDERNNFVENAGKLPMKTQISVTSHMAMVDIINAPLPEGLYSDEDNNQHIFPPHPTITYFLQLFFVHVHPRFPVLHVATFDPNGVPPILLLAMAISGSSYSESNKSKFALTYLTRVRLSIRFMQERDQNYVSS